MAMLFAVASPGGERAIATGYPGAAITVDDDRRALAQLGARVLG